MIDHIGNPLQVMIGLIALVSAAYALWTGKIRYELTEGRVGKELEASFHGLPARLLGFVTAIFGIWIIFPGLAPEPIEHFLNNAFVISEYWTNHE